MHFIGFDLIVPWERQFVYNSLCDFVTIYYYLLHKYQYSIIKIINTVILKFFISEFLNNLERTLFDRMNPRKLKINSESELRVSDMQKMNPIPIVNPL